MKHLLLIFFMSILSLNSFGQKHVCGTIDDGSIMARLEENKKVMEKHLQHRSGNDWIFIPVQFIIVSDANGVGGVEERQILDELCIINEDYAPYKMKFYITPEFSYVKNNALYNDPRSSFAEAKIKTSKNKNALNIFIVNQIPNGSTYGQILGYYTPILDVIVVLKNQIGVNDKTLSHEIGHFFSLQHPFLGWEQTPYQAVTHGNPVKIQKIDGNDIELVNRSNCNTAADKLCDTPPDYNFGILDPEQNCKLNGPILDFNKDTIITQENNFMSYFFNCSTYQFTPMQIAAIRADYASTLRSHLRLGEIPDTSHINISNFKVITPLENETTPYYDQVTIDWEDTPGATNYYVSIYPPSAPNTIKHIFIKGESKVVLTDLEKNKKYIWNVKPYTMVNTCVKKLGPYSFKTGAYTVGIEEELSEGENMQVFPNPVSYDQFYIYSKSDFSDVEIRMYNSIGQVVESWTSDISSGTNTINLNKSNYQKGFYNLILKTKDRDYIRRIIIQ